jgi:hypothetical protein
MFIDYDTGPAGSLQPSCVRTPYYWLGREAGRMAVEIGQGTDTRVDPVTVPYRDVLTGDTLGPVD